MGFNDIFHLDLPGFSCQTETTGQLAFKVVSSALCERNIRRIYPHGSTPCLARYDASFVLDSRLQLTQEQQITQHYSRLLIRWPVDRLRPDQPHFQDLIRKRIAAAPAGQRDESKEVNAAYLLLDNTFAKQSPLSDRIMKPASNPNHYTDLAKELEEAPDRTWLGNMMKRMSGLIRFR